MDTPVAELITDADKAPLLTMSGGVWRATHFYRINTGLELRAAGAVGLPRYATPYPGTFDGGAAGTGTPALKCSGCEIRRTHGTDDPQTGVGGWSEARVEFAEDAAGEVLPDVTTRYSEIECVTSSVHITNGLDDSDLTTGAFANGRGASKDVGGTIVRITSYMMPDAFQSLLTRLIQLQQGQRYNDEEIVIPPILGARETMTIPAGWAQYSHYSTEFAAGLGGILRLRQVLKVSPDGYLVQWRKINELAVPVGPVIPTPIYERADFDGLW